MLPTQNKAKIVKNTVSFKQGAAMLARTFGAKRAGLTAERAAELAKLVNLATGRSLGASDVAVLAPAGGGPLPLDALVERFVCEWDMCTGDGLRVWEYVPTGKRQGGTLFTLEFEDGTLALALCDDEKLDLASLREVACQVGALDPAGPQRVIPMRTALQH